MIYKAVAPLPTSIPPEIIGPEIEAIKRLHGGVCSPEAYVDWARPVDSPLHPSLPWDDAVLGEQRRREIARVIIRLVVIARNKADLPPRNISVQVAGVDGTIEQGFVAARMAAKPPDLRRQVLLSTLTHIRGLLRNRAWLTELQPILDAVEAVERSLTIHAEDKAA